MSVNLIIIFLNSWIHHLLKPQIAEPKVTFSNCWFCLSNGPKSKDDQLKVKVWHFGFKHDWYIYQNSFWLVQFFAEHHEHKRAHNIAMDGLSWSSSIGERVLLPEGSEAPDWLHYQPVTLFEFAPLFAGLSEEKLLCESSTEFSHVRLCFFLLIHLV